MEYRPFYLAREWQREGHEAVIVGASRSHMRSTQPKMRGISTEEEVEGVRYIWLRTPPYVGNGLGRILNMICFVILLFVLAARIAWRHRPDVVVASSTYPLDIFPCHLIAKLAKARLAFEVHDLWPLSPQELGNLPAWHPAILVMQLAENYAYRHADVVISMLPKAKDHMMAHGMTPGKFVHIPNGISLDEWTEVASAGPLPAQHEQALQQAKSHGGFTVCYAGAHGLANALESFVEAGRLLQGSGITLFLVGHGPEKGRLEALARGLDNVVLLPPVPKAAIPKLLAAVDALYIGLQRQSLFRFGISPNKLLDYLMAGRPILHAIEAGNDLVQESGSGISVAAENPEAIVSGLRRLKAMSSEEREQLGRNGRAFALAHHDYRQLAREFIAALERPDGNTQPFDCTAKV